MRHSTSKALAHILTFKCEQKITEPRRRLIRALVADYRDYNLPEGYSFPRIEGSNLVSIQHRKSLGDGFTAEVIGFCHITD